MLICSLLLQGLSIPKLKHIIAQQLFLLTLNKKKICISGGQ